MSNAPGPTPPVSPTNVNAPAGATAQKPRRGCGCLGIVALTLLLLALIGSCGSHGRASSPSRSATPAKVVATRATSPVASPSATPPAASVSPNATTSATPSANSVASPAADPTLTPDPSAGTKAADALAGIPVKGRAAKTGYDRAKFGQQWYDLDRNGCDTRNDILRRDLVDITLKDGTHGCVVLTGTLHDPYTATTIAFERGQGTSNAVEIDHVVALADAWQKGAEQLSDAQRTAFANDPLNLLAVDGPTNQKKRDGDAATWLPPNKGFRCAYVARQTAVKAKYGLWMTQAEHDAIARILDGCPEQTLPDSSVAEPTAQPAAEQEAPAPAVQPAAEPVAPREDACPAGDYTGSRYDGACGSAPAAPAPVAAPVPQGGGVYFKNCSQARKAGAAPLYRGQPGYRPELDRDGDGIACEG